MHCHQHADFTWSEKMLDAGLPIAAVAVRHCSEPTLLTKCCCSPSFLAMAPQLIRNPIKRVISHFYFGRKLRFHDCMLDHQTVSSFLKNEDGCRAITTTITGDGQSGVWWFGGKAPWMARGAGGLSVPVLLSPWSCSLVLFWFLPFFFFCCCFPVLARTLLAPARASSVLPLPPLTAPLLAGHTPRHRRAHGEQLGQLPLQRRRRCGAKHNRAPQDAGRRDCPSPSRGGQHAQVRARARPAGGGRGWPWPHWQAWQAC